MDCFTTLDLLEKWYQWIGLLGDICKTLNFKEILLYLKLITSLQSLIASHSLNTRYISFPLEFC
jgi:hypothetical protein